MEVTQQNRLSLDCSGEGTEMFASLLIGLRNVGTQRTQHPHAGRQFLFPHAFEQMLPGRKPPNLPFSLIKNAGILHL